MPKKPTGHDRRLKWGDGWIVERTTARGETRYQARRHDAPARTFATLAEAEAHLRDTADRGYVPPERTTVAQLVTAFLDRAAHRIAPSTLGQHRSRLRSLIAPELGTVPLPMLTAPRVQHWLDGLTKRGKSPETIAGARRLLSAACKEAVVLGMLATNPVTGTRTPAVRPPRMATWTEEEVRVVLAVVGADPMLDAAYRVALSTGVRPGELLALRWSDLDLAAGVLVVKRTRSRDEDYREVVSETTKGKRSRAIALQPSTVAALRAWKRAQAALRLASPVWRDPEAVLTEEDGRAMRREVWAGVHEGVIVVAGAKRITPHGCRHAFATLALERGIPVKVVSDVLGHRSSAFTADRYQHTDERLQRGTLGAMADIYDGGDTTTKDAKWTGN